MPYRVIKFIENRIFEWYTSTVMLLIGIMMCIWPDAVERGLFRFILSLFDDDDLRVVCLVFSVVRIAALFGAERWEFWSPRLRILGAGVGALFWGQMGASITVAGVDTNGVPSLSIPILAMMVIGELISVWRAARTLP